MREVLFRGKSVVTGDWIYGVPVSNDYITCIFKLIDGLGELNGFQVKPETVGQCTGLTDKNGTKIFEGDIVKIWDNGEARGVVRWCDEDATFEFYIDGCAWNFGGLRDFCLDKTVEVIGNVHDEGIDIIREMPTIEAEPVRHGRWIPQYVSKRGLSNFFACSECNKTSFTYHKVKMCSYKYCSNCGAKMDRGDFST